MSTDGTSYFLWEQHLQVFLFTPWNSQDSIFLPTTTSVSLSAACQKRWVTTLAQTEWVHMWDVVFLVWVGQLRMETRVQFHGWPAGGRRDPVMLLPERAWRAAGGLCQHILAPSPPPHPPALNTHIWFTSPPPNYHRQTISKTNRSWDEAGSHGDVKSISLTLKAKHCDTEPSADISVNHDAPLSPRLSTFATPDGEWKASPASSASPGCRGSRWRRWPPAGARSAPWVSGASINHQKQEPGLTFPATEGDVPSSLISLMTFGVKSALHYKSGANDGDLPLKRRFTPAPIKRSAAPSLWKRFACQMIVIHGIMQILQGNMSSNTAHTLAINCRNWRGADGRWGRLHRTIFCHLGVKAAPQASSLKLSPLTCALRSKSGPVA